METLDYNRKKREKACPKINCRKDNCKCGLEKVVIPSVLGDDSPSSSVAPKNGAYCNAIVVYEANDHVYVYSTEGIPTLINVEGGSSEEAIEELTEKLNKEILDRGAADDALQQEIDDLKNSPDVVDIVATYAALQAYDTSKLGDNDIIRVLADETHDGQSTYYRWDKHNSTWTYIGAVGDYYTKGQVDTLLADKQNELTAGSNIAITQSGDDLVISATDTTYSSFVGTDGVTAGSAGLVPAPATTDAGKFLKADGTWDTAGGGGPTVVQTTGTSQTDVMSQNATTSMVFADPATQRKIKIGANTFTPVGDDAIEIGKESKAKGVSTVAIGPEATVDSFANYGLAIGASTTTFGTDAIAIGYYAGTNNEKAVALGRGAQANHSFAVALGAGATTSVAGEINVGTGSFYPTKGYNGTSYRLLSGLHDAQGDHDAVTLGQLNGRVKQNAGAPTTSTVGTVGQLLEDTTNGKLYQCTAVDTTDPNNPIYTWSEVGAGGGGPTVVQSTGASITDVMSQKAVTDELYPQYSAKSKGVIGVGNYFSIANYGDSKIGIGKVTLGNLSAYALAINSGDGNGTVNSISGMGIWAGEGGTVTGHSGVAIGNGASVSGAGGVAIGANSSSTQQGEFNIGTSNTSRGYNSTNYRLISGVHDGQDIHDAATVAQGNTLSASAPDSSTVGVLGQLWTDTTNMHTYQCTAISGSTYTWQMRW